MTTGVEAQQEEKADRHLAELADLERFERSPISSETAPAGLRLASSWLLHGEWLEASGLLQEVLELATDRGEHSTAVAAQT